MRVGYVTTYDSSDVHVWSGLGYHIMKCLQLAGMTVERIGPLHRRAGMLSHLRQVEAKLRGQHYPLDRDPGVVGAYAAQVARRLQAVPCDLVFSPGTIPIAHLNSSRPVALWADATFGAMLRLYPDFQSLSQRAVWNGIELETRCLARVDVAFYASEWAAQSAVNDHGADPAKVDVVPFGANMPVHHDRDAVVEHVRRRSHDIYHLLWVGVDWVRKGGDVAVETVRVLNERGLPAELHIVGCMPSLDLPRWVHLYGYLDKSTEAGISRLRHLYETAHVLIHPATAECFGVVFCEAAAHGVLSVASRVGGIPSAVRDGITGALLDPAASAEEYADHVWRLLEERARYEIMAVRAFDEYERVLSWDVQARRVGARLADLV